MDRNFIKIIKTELQTCTNMWLWPKTKLWTYRTSPKSKQFTNIKLFVPPLIYMKGSENLRLSKTRARLAGAQLSKLRLALDSLIFLGLELSWVELLDSSLVKKLHHLFLKCHQCCISTISTILKWLQKNIAEGFLHTKKTASQKKEAAQHFSHCLPAKQGWRPRPRRHASPYHST